MKCGLFLCPPEASWRWIFVSMSSYPWTSPPTTPTTTQHFITMKSAWFFWNIFDTFIRGKNAKIIRHNIIQSNFIYKCTCTRTIYNKIQCLKVLGSRTKLIIVFLPYNSFLFNLSVVTLWAQGCGVSGPSELLQRGTPRVFYGHFRSTCCLPPSSYSCNRHIDINYHIYKHKGLHFPPVSELCALSLSLQRGEIVPVQTHPSRETCGNPEKLIQPKPNKKEPYWSHQI